MIFKSINAKVLTTIICEALLFSGCFLMMPNKEVGSYLESISYKPDNYQSIVGTYSTEPNLSGTKISLFIDSTFHFETWGDLVDLNKKDEGIYGKYFINGDTLLLISEKTTYIDSLKKNYNKFISEILSNIKHTFFRYPFHFMKIGNEIYIISGRDKSDYLQKYYFVGNVEEQIMNGPKKNQ